MLVLINPYNWENVWKKEKNGENMTNNDDPLIEKT